MDDRSWAPAARDDLWISVPRLAEITGETPRRIYGAIYDVDDPMPHSRLGRSIRVRLCYWHARRRSQGWSRMLRVDPDDGGSVALMLWQAPLSPERYKAAQRMLTLARELRGLKREIKSDEETATTLDRAGAGIGAISAVGAAWMATSNPASAFVLTVLASAITASLVVRWLWRYRTMRVMARRVLEIEAHLDELNDEFITLQLQPGREDGSPKENG